MEVKIIATGSSGNCTLIKSRRDKILLDVGVPYKKFMAGLKYQPPGYALITHEHLDHAQRSAIKRLMCSGVDIYMTAGTKDALQLTDRHNLHVIKAGEKFKVGNTEAKAYHVEHDAAEPVAFGLFGDENLLYATDMKYPPTVGEDVFNKLLLEVNYFTDWLKTSAMDKTQKERILNNHASFERVKGWLLVNYDGKWDKLKGLYLMHISNRHGSGEKFAQKLNEYIFFGNEIPIRISE